MSDLLTDKQTKLVEEAIQILKTQVAEAESDDFSLNQRRVERFWENKLVLDQTLSEVEDTPLIHQCLGSAALAYHVGFTLLVACVKWDTGIAMEADQAAYGVFKPWRDRPQLVEQTVLSQDKSTATKLFDFMLAASRDFTARTEDMMGLNWQKVEEDDYDAQTHLERAQYWRMQGNLTKAIECANSAITKDPLMVEAHVALGLLIAQNDPQAAIESFRSAIRVDPDYLLAYWNLYFGMLAIGNAAEAIKMLEEIIARVPDGENIMLFDNVSLNTVYMRLGGHFKVLGRDADAERAFAVGRRLTG